MTAPEGELPPRVNLFPTRDGMCVSRDSTYKGNIPYVLASELEAEKQRGLRAVEEARAAAFEEAVDDLLEASEDFEENVDAPALLVDYLREKAKKSRAAKEPS